MANTQAEVRQHIEDSVYKLMIWAMLQPDKNLRHLMCKQIVDTVIQHTVPACGNCGGAARPAVCTNCINKLLIKTNGVVHL